MASMAQPIFIWNNLMLFMTVKSIPIPYLIRYYANDIPVIKLLAKLCIVNGISSTCKILDITARLI